MTRSLASVVLALALLLPLVGCRTRRYLEITTNPPGAEVRLDDERVGITPVKVPFEHFGVRRVTFYKPGYQTTSRRIKLRAPWYARFPLDLVSEVLLPVGLRDRRKVHQELVPGESMVNLPSLRSVIERASVLRQAGPQGPRELPAAEPSVVPSEPEPAAEPPAPEPAPQP